MANKLTEAEELVKKAQKCMKTSLLKWSPDVDSAIDYYKKAVVIYRNLKKFQEAADLNMKIADLYAQNGSFFHCAKAYESAALLYRDLGDYNKVVDCLGTAGQIMRQNGVADSATTLYGKGAKLLETARPEDSARFYDHAAETSELEDKYLQAADFATQSARIWVRLQRLKEAETQLRRAMHLAISDTSDEAAKTAYQVCGKAVVVLVIVKLIQEDSVAANKVYGEALEKYRFGETDDAMAVARLIQIYEAYDSTAASEVLSQPTFRNLETEFARLARTINFPKGFEDQESITGAAELQDIC
nr:Gamma soluble NSF attachment protein [Hymenolepis microstoma]